MSTDFDRSEAASSIDGSGNGKPSFSKATVVLQSRTALPTFTRAPLPSSVVVGMPHFDQKLDELTAERKAARRAAEAMANLSVLPVAAVGQPRTLDSVQSVVVASASESDHHGSSSAPPISNSTATPSDMEPSDTADMLSASHPDKYSSYDRHFKKKFFGSERRPPTTESTKVGDADQAAGNGGRNGNTPSPDVGSSIACKKARLSEPSRITNSPQLATARTPTPPRIGPHVTTSAPQEPLSLPLPLQPSENNPSQDSPSAVLATGLADPDAPTVSSSVEASVPVSDAESIPSVAEPISDSTSQLTAAQTSDHLPVATASSPGSSRPWSDVHPRSDLGGPGPKASHQS